MIIFAVLFIRAQIHKPMYVIKISDHPTNGMFAYLVAMVRMPTKDLELSFGPTYRAFRFPDEQAAQAVLKFLNRDNLEVVCIDHPGSDR